MRPRVEQRDFSEWRAVGGHELQPIEAGVPYVVYRIPGFYVDPQGLVTGILGGAEARTAAESFFANHAAVPFGSAANWERMSDDEGLQSLVNHWWKSATRLSCLTPDFSGEYSSTDTDWIPRINDLDIQARITLEPVQCGDQRCERRMVDLRPNEEQSLALIRQRVGGPNDGVLRMALHQISTGLFDADGRLLEMAMTKETTMVQSNSGREFTVVDLDTVTYRFVPRQESR